MKLYQLQCQREGSLFYYQTGLVVTANILSLVSRCPVCGSKRVELTGRTFAPVDEAYKD